MGKIKNTLTVLALTGAIASTGCENTTTTQQKNVVCKVIEDGTNLRILPVTSNKSYWGDKQNEVRKEVERIVNSGEYNVVSVKTSYSDAYLTSAEIKYSISRECDNKDLRIIFLHSNKSYWGDKQNEVKPKLENIVNSGKYDIQDVNTIMLKGYLVAAEVYYRENGTSRKKGD